MHPLWAPAVLSSRTGLDKDVVPLVETHTAERVKYGCVVAVVHRERRFHGLVGLLLRAVHARLHPSRQTRGK